MLSPVLLSSQSTMSQKIKRNVCFIVFQTQISIQKFLKKNRVKQKTLRKKIYKNKKWSKRRPRKNIIVQIENVHKCN